jgi:hypothetical protein
VPERAGLKTAIGFCNGTSRRRDPTHQSGDRGLTSGRIRRVEVRRCTDGSVKIAIDAIQAAARITLSVCRSQAAWRWCALAGPSSLQAPDLMVAGEGLEPSIFGL